MRTAIVNLLKSGPGPSRRGLRWFFLHVVLGIFPYVGLRVGQWVYAGFDDSRSERNS